MFLEDFKKEKITAMKAHDANAVSALNVVIDKLMLLGIEKRAKGESLIEADSTSALQKTEKELVEEKEGYEKANRPQSVAALEAQLATVRKYMPKMLSEDEIVAIVSALEDKSVPAVMKHFKANYNGLCDMRLVNAVLVKFKQ